MKLKNIPNILSMIRICLVFVFVALFFTMEKPYAALLIFLLAGATDVVDGYLARRNNWITNLGKILDPVADKLMQCTVLVCLYIKSYIPLWFVLPFIGKELLSLILGYVVIKRRSVAIVSKWYGKFTVCLFYATIAISMIFKEWLGLHPIISIVIFVPAVICAIATLVAYVKHYAFLKKLEVRKGDLFKMGKEQ